MRLSFSLPIVLLSCFLLVFPRCSCDQIAYTQLSPAMILVNPSEIDFGPVPVDSFVSGKFTILNEGQRPLSISGFALDTVDAPFATELNSFTIDNESSVDVVVHIGMSGITFFQRNHVVF